MSTDTRTQHLTQQELQRTHSRRTLPRSLLPPLHLQPLVERRRMPPLMPQVGAHRVQQQVVEPLRRLQLRPDRSTHRIKGRQPPHKELHSLLADNRPRRLPHMHHTQLRLVMMLAALHSMPPSLLLLLPLSPQSIMKFVPCTANCDR